MLEVTDVSKSFKKEKILDHVSFRVETGEIAGIIGRNGSGKTVLFKIVCGFYTADAGSVSIDGKYLGKDLEVPENIGSIIETPGFLNSYPAYRNLKFLADIRGVAKKEEILRAIRTVGLDPANRKKVGKYSLGMRQRLGLAQAIMEDPDILVLDEPMNGLDNKGVEDMRQLLLGLKEQGKTILLASHNREDIEVLCDKVYEMDHGVLTEKKDERMFVAPQDYLNSEYHAGV